MLRCLAGREPTDPALHGARSLRALVAAAQQAPRGCREIDLTAA